MGEKLTRKRERAIEALLEEPTLAKAAGRTGISERTLRGWLKQAEFSTAYRDARRQIVEGSIGRLQQVSAEAVNTLRRNLDCGNASVETRSAIAILDQSLKAIELLDLSARLDALEARVQM